MGFYGQHFSFNGTPCEKFGLAIYDIDGNSQGKSGFVASVGKVVEDWIPTKSRSLFYGIQQNTPLTFTMTFGVDPELQREHGFITMDDYLDRWEITQINNWLTGHKDGRKWLEIEQPDMDSIRFSCTITDLDIITHAWYPWAFTCTVTCDSPYGYMHPKTYHYTCSGTKTVNLVNKSFINDFYSPVMIITPQSLDRISIINMSDENREFRLERLPGGTGKEIYIDNDRGIIKTADGSNIYDYFNFNFFRLCPGNNQLALSGNFTLKVLCEFPVNVGG